MKRLKLIALLQEQACEEVALTYNGIVCTDIDVREVRATKPNKLGHRFVSDRAKTTLLALSRAGTTENLEKEQR